MVIAHAVVAAESGHSVTILMDDGPGARIATSEISRLPRLASNGHPVGSITLASTLTILGRAAGGQHLPDRAATRDTYNRLPLRSCSSRATDISCVCPRGPERVAQDGGKLSWWSLSTLCSWCAVHSRRAASSPASQANVASPCHPAAVSAGLDAHAGRDLLRAGGQPRKRGLDQHPDHHPTPLPGRYVRSPGVRAPAVLVILILGLGCDSARLSGRAAGGSTGSGGVIVGTGHAPGWSGGVSEGADAPERGDDVGCPGPGGLDFQLPAAANHAVLSLKSCEGNRPMPQFLPVLMVSSTLACTLC